MNATFEFFIAIIASSLVYAARGWFGKQLLSLVFWLLKLLGKKVLRISKEEMRLYRKHKEEARLSRIARAPKRHARLS